MSISTLFNSFTQIVSWCGSVITAFFSSIGNYVNQIVILINYLPSFLTTSIAIVIGFCFLRFVIDR